MKKDEIFRDYSSTNFLHMHIKKVNARCNLVEKFEKIEFLMLWKSYLLIRHTVTSLCEYFLVVNA